MIRDIVYQISVFSDFTSIEPNDETIQSMISKFSDYRLFPAVFQEGNFTISSNANLSKSETTLRRRPAVYSSTVIAKGSLCNKNRRA